jgi:hypothetical protein
MRVVNPGAKVMDGTSTQPQHWGGWKPGDRGVGVRPTNNTFAINGARSPTDKCI